VFVGVHFELPSDEFGNLNAVLSIRSKQFMGEAFCLLVLLVVGSRGFFIGLSVETPFLRVAVTAGTSVHTTSGVDTS